MRTRELLPQEGTLSMRNCRRLRTLLINTCLNADGVYAFLSPTLNQKLREHSYMDSLYCILRLAVSGKSGNKSECGDRLEAPR